MRHDLLEGALGIFCQLCFISVWLFDPWSEVLRFNDYQITYPYPEMYKAVWASPFFCFHQYYEMHMSKEIFSSISMSLKEQRNFPSVCRQLLLLSKTLNCSCKHFTCLFKVIFSFHNDMPLLWVYVPPPQRHYNILHVFSLHLLKKS